MHSLLSIEDFFNGKKNYLCHWKKKYKRADELAIWTYMNFFFNFLFPLTTVCLWTARKTVGTPSKRWGDFLIFKLIDLRKRLQSQGTSTSSRNTATVRMRSTWETFPGWIKRQIRGSLFSKWTWAPHYLANWYLRSRGKDRTQNTLSHKWLKGIFHLLLNTSDL